MVEFKNSLEKSIFSTIAYFDIFDYPLTLVEIWKWLYHPVDQFGPPERNNILEIQKVLEESSKLKSLVDFRQGFYFLKERGNLVELRQKRYNLAEKKIKKSLKAIRFFKFIPGIKMIAVCNDLAWSNAPEKSDIDIFVVTAKNKIWSVRFWAAGFLKIFGLRPSPRKTQDKICLSFLVDEDNLNLESIALKQPDIYLIYWIAQLAPVYDRSGIYDKFITVNEWIKKYLPNFFATEISERRTLASGREPDLSGLKQFPGFVERFFRWLQLKVMPKKLKEMANKDTRVVVNDAVLKFHANDRRFKFKMAWEEKIKKYI